MEDTLRQILRQMDKLERKAEVADEKLNSINATQEKIEKSMEKIASTVYGNGKKGLVERMAIVEHRLQGKDKDEDVEAAHDFEKYITLRNAIIGLGVAAVGFLAGAGYDWLKGVLS